jgi:hypothetical protein
MSPQNVFASAMLLPTVTTGNEKLFFRMSTKGILKAGHFVRQLKFGAQRTRVSQKFDSFEICLRLGCCAAQVGLLPTFQESVVSFPLFQGPDVRGERRI